MLGIVLASFAHMRDLMKSETSDHALNGQLFCDSLGAGLGGGLSRHRSLVNVPMFSPLFIINQACFHSKGLGEDAERHYKMALVATDSLAEAHNNLGILYTTPAFDK